MNICPVFCTVKEPKKRPHPCKNGKIYYAGAWRSLTGVFQVKNRDRERAKKVTPEQRKNWKVKKVNRWSLFTEEKNTEQINDRTKGIKNVEKNTEKSGTLGTPKIERIIVKNKNSASMRTTRADTFSEPSMNFSEEYFHMISLIDDSSSHLHGLMKSATKTESVDQRLHCTQINAACGAARQLHVMLKIKVLTIKQITQLQKKKLTK